MMSEASDEAKYHLKENFIFLLVVIYPGAIQDLKYCDYLFNQFNLVLDGTRK